MNNLKPCPFCGVKGTKFINHYKIIHKENCYLAFTTIIEDQKDIKAWNTRASSWIKCEDKLPEIGSLDSCDYLCRCEYNILVLTWITDENGKGKFYFDTPKHFDDYTDCVTHWQPLPEDR